MLVDIIIILLAVSALYRGRELGFVRQLGSTAGFFIGLFIGAALEPHTVSLVHGQVNRTLVTILTTLGCALIMLTVGEYSGIWLKYRVRPKPLDRVDTILGGFIGVLTLLFGTWLLAAIINSSPFPDVQTAVHNSRIVRLLTNELPQAPQVIAGLGHLIDPNGFPQVFIGAEPNPPANIKLPTLGQMQAAVQQDEASVVKVEGQGCGGTVEGSGFVVGNNLIATNAHVIAGITQPYVVDGNGVHKAKALVFDPNLDFAVLQVNNLAGPPLHVSGAKMPAGTAAAVMGYPGGGSLTASTAAILDQFTARGRNIYDRGATLRDVYEIQADVIPGNSGGPVIDIKGNAIGVVFAESTSYAHVGYALTSDEVTAEVQQAMGASQTVSTGQCAG